MLVLLVPEPVTCHRRAFSRVWLAVAFAGRTGGGRDVDEVEVELDAARTLGTARAPSSAEVRVPNRPPETLVVLDRDDCKEDVLFLLGGRCEEPADEDPSSCRDAAPSMVPGSGGSGSASSDASSFALPFLRGCSSSPGPGDERRLTEGRIGEGGTAEETGSRIFFVQGLGLLRGISHKGPE